MRMKALTRPSVGRFSQGGRKEDTVKRKKGSAATALLGAIAEAEAKTTVQADEDLNALKDLLPILSGPR